MFELLPRNVRWKSGGLLARLRICACSPGHFLCDLPWKKFTHRRFARKQDVFWQKQLRNLEYSCKILALTRMRNFLRICVFGKNVNCSEPRAELKTSTGKFTSSFSKCSSTYAQNNRLPRQLFFYSESFLIRILPTPSRAVYKL